MNINNYQLNKFLTQSNKNNGLNKINIKNNDLNEYLQNYSIKKVTSDGASGAPVFLLFNKENNKLEKILKIYHEKNEEYKKLNKTNNRLSISSNTSNKTNNRLSISSNTSNKTYNRSSTSSNISNKTNHSNSSNQEYYNGDLHFIRGLRDIYLNVTLYIKQKDLSENEKISPDVYLFGFIDDFSIENENLTGLRPFIVMEAFSNGYTELKNINPKNISDMMKIKIMYELCVSLLKLIHYIKNVGCHRDLHPGNIFIKLPKYNNGKNNNNGNVIVKFIDFDLSITNRNNLTKNFHCSRRTLSPSKKYLKQVTRETEKYIGTSSHLISTWHFGHKVPLINSDADLYQYYLYYKYFSNNFFNEQYKNNFRECFDDSLDYIKNNINDYQKKKENKNKSYKLNKISAKIKFLKKLQEKLKYTFIQPNKYVIVNSNSGGPI